MIGVGIIEDHPVFRQGLAQTIETAPGMSLAFAVGSVEEFERLGIRPDVAIVDLGLPGVRGAEAVRRVHGLGVEVLVVSADGHHQEVVNALAAGASGYVTKLAQPSEILTALEAVASDGSYVSPALAACLLRTDRERAGSLALTAREREVLVALAGGDTDQDIAERLYISVRTVRSHLDRIRDKTGRRRRPDLTRLAMEEGMLSSDKNREPR